MPRVNRYTAPAEDRYQSTYLPLPYEQIMATVASRQAQLDKQQDLMNRTYEDTKNIKYIPGTKNEEYVRDYIGKSGDLVSKYMSSDMTDPVVKQQMFSEFRNITDKTKLQNIETNWQNWSDNNKIRQRLTAEGKYSPYLDEDPAKNPEFGAMDEIYNYTTPQFDSYLPEAQRFWSNVKPGLLKDPKTGKFMQTDEGYHLSGYSDSDLENYANLNWGTFAETPTGRAWITSEIRSRGLEENDVNRQDVAKELLWNQRPQGGPNLEGSRSPMGASSRRSGGGSDEMPEYRPSVTKDAPGESLLGDERWKPKNIYNKQSELGQQIAATEKAIEEKIKVNPDDPGLQQMNINLQSLKDRKEVLDNVVEIPKEYWEAQLAPEKEEAEKTFIEAMNRKGIDYKYAKNQYRLYEEAKKLSDELQWKRTSVISSDPNNMFKIGTGTALDLTNAFLNIVKGTGEVVTQPGQKMLKAVLSDPEASELFINEFDKFKEGEISFGEALKNSVSGFSHLYKDFHKSVNLDKESRIFIDKKVRDDVVKYYNKVSDVNRRIEENTDKDIKDSNNKSVYGKQILSLPMGTDDDDNLFFIDRTGKKNYVDGSRLFSEMKQNPEGWAMIQTDAVDDKNLKDRNKEIEDLHANLRNATTVTPTAYSPDLNEDGSFDIHLTTKFRNKDTGANVTSRNIKVRLTDQSQINAMTEIIRNAGFDVEAERISDPSMSRDIKANQPKEIGDVYTVRPYADKWYSYRIKKTGKNEWEVLDEAGNKVKTKDRSDNEVELPSFSSIDEVIHYLYGVRLWAHEQSQQLNSIE